MDQECRDPNQVNGKKRQKGNKCVFVNCKNNASNATLHRFPPNETISREWVLKSGNTKLSHFSPYTLSRQKLVCSDHFRDEDYCNPSKKVRLKGGVVPLPYKPISGDLENDPSCSLSELEVKEHRESTSAESPEATSISPEIREIIESIKKNHIKEKKKSKCTQSVKDNTELKHLRDIVASQRKLINEKDATIRKLRKRLKANAKVKNLQTKDQDRSKYRETVARTIHKNGQKWHEDIMYILRFCRYTKNMSLWKLCFSLCLR